jgi:hypothetical protein
MDNHNAVTVVTRNPPATADAERMHPLVRLAMGGGTAPDPAMLRELLAVQREWEAGEARRAYTAAMVGLKRDLPTVIGHDAVVDFTSSKGRTYYTHTSLAKVMDEITPALTQHGFSLGYSCSTESKVTVTCRLTHADGHSEEMTISAPPDTNGNKGPAQAIASTITMLQRYTALALLGIATADMKEPTGEGAPADGGIDHEKNMRAVTWLTSKGRTVEDAVRHIGRRPDAWTDADRQEIKRWANPPRPADANTDEPPAGAGLPSWG